MSIAHDKHMRNVANPFPPALCARHSSRNTRLTQRSMGDNVDTNAPCTDMVGSSTCPASGLNVAGWVCPLCAGRLAWLTTNFAALFKSCRVLVGCRGSSWVVQRLPISSHMVP